MNDMYIGPKKVVDNVSLDNKLVTGEDLFELTYDDGTKEILTRRMFEGLIKDTATDLTTLRDNRVFPVVARALELFLNWGLKIDEVDYLMAVVTRSVNNNLQEADDMLWKKKRIDLTLMDLDTILRAPTGVTLQDVGVEAGNEPAKADEVPAKVEEPTPEPIKADDLEPKVENPQ